MSSWISSLRVLPTSSRRVSRDVRTVGRVETSMRRVLVVRRPVAEPARVVRLEGSCGGGEFVCQLGGIEWVGKGLDDDEEEEA
jgi:hypothetical protein